MNLMRIRSITMAFASLAVLAGVSIASPAMAQDAFGSEQDLPISLWEPLVLETTTV